MQFKLVRTGRSYAEPQQLLPAGKTVAIDPSKTVAAHAIIWETGKVAEIRSLLVLREAELVVAKTHLTGEPCNDWFTHNRIRDLEIKIAQLRSWLEPK